MCSQQVFPLESSAEVGHNGVDIVDEQALEDQEGKRLLINSYSFQALNHLLGNLLEVVFLPMDLHECKAKIEEEVSNRLKLPSYSIVD